VEFEEDAYPVTVNDPKVTPRVATLLQEIPGIRVVSMDPVLGGEDFSRFLQKAPGTFFYLGTENKSKGCIYPNHSSKFKVDEDVLKYGAAALALVASAFASGEVSP
jgi:carboxypeptidase Ss1